MIKLDLAHKNFVKNLEEQGRSKSTVIAYTKDIEQLTEHLFKKGINFVEDIETAHLEEFMAKLASQSYTAKSISRKTNSTKTFFRFLKDNNQLDKNVAEQLRHPKVEIKAPRILSKLEYRALRDAARVDVRTFAIIELLLQTGIRISELAQIKIADLAFKEPASLSIQKVDNHPARAIPLNNAAAEAIGDYLTIRPEMNREHLFITKTGKPLLIRNIRATIDRFFKSAGIESARVNDLRHTFVTHHLAQGTNLLTVSKIAGHKRVSTTERYLQYIEVNSKEEKTALGEL